ncbi:Beta-lactamase [Chitinispirillum alkaliphilum]|nr:Beta-lactamase [Chitinispirillum alkaliphilum]
MLEQIRSCLKQAIEEKAFPGAVVGISVNGERSFVSEGRFTYEPDSKKMWRDAIFDCASITKSIPTSALALHLIDHGMLSLSDRLISYVPEYKGCFRENIQIKHLLTHTLEFNFRLSDYKELSPSEIIETIFSVKLKSAPGENFFYANATSILLGLVIERICAKKLPEIAKEVFFNPLGMNETTFYPDSQNENIVPTERDPWRGREIRGEVHDESAWALRPVVIAGSAGLFSKAADLLAFSEMLLAGGTDGNRRFFSEKMVRLMQTNQLSGTKGKKTGLGWELDQEYMGRKRGSQTFGKTGFTGTVIVCDLPRQVSFVLLSNFTWPSRKKDRSQINRIRSQVSDLVFDLAEKRHTESQI